MHWSFLGKVLCSCKTFIHYILVNKGRFKSQALLDEQAIITCMAYVDLNPVRAGVAALPETSNFTAIQQRIQPLNKPPKKAENKTPIKLAKFCKPPKKNRLPTAETVHQGQRSTGVIPFYWRDYLELIDWTGRAILPNKTGSIAMAEPKILQRLNIDSGDWLDNMPRIEKDFHHCIGRGDSIKPCAEKLDQCWVKGVGAARRLFGC